MNLNKPLRLGIYTFAIMSFISNVGYTLFKLSDSGYAGTFQDFMHVFVITALVVLLSIVSLVLVMVGGYREKKYRALAIWATIALTAMLIGGLGTAVVPKAYFGVVERFSVFATSGFQAVLGIYLFQGRLLSS